MPYLVVDLDHSDGTNEAVMFEHPDRAMLLRDLMKIVQPYGHWVAKYAEEVPPWYTW